MEAGGIALQEAKERVISQNPVVRALQYASAGVNRLAEVVTVMATLAMTLIMIAEVVNRVFFRSSFFWSFELAQSSFLWLSFAGASIAYRRGELVGMNFIKIRVHGLAGVVLRAFMSMVVLAFLATMVYYGIAFLLGTSIWPQRSPASGLPVAINFAAFPFGFVCMTVHMLAHSATEIELFFREGKRP